MKNMKNLLAMLTLMAVLMIGASTAKAGLLVSDFASTEETPCTETNDDSKLDWGVILNGATGVIVNGFTGVIVNGFTGVIVNGATDTDENCGVIVNG